MKKTILTVFTILTICVTAFDVYALWGNENDKSVVGTLPPYVKPEGVMQATPGMIWDWHKANGWRTVVLTQQVESGWAVESYIATNFIGDQCDAIIGSQYNIAERAAQEAAAAATAESNRLETPIKFDQPIQGKFETSGGDGHIYGFEVDPVDGSVFAQERESTRKSNAQYNADCDSNRQARHAKKDKKKNALTNLVNQVNALSAQSFNGQQKQDISDIIKAVRDIVAAMQGE
jgi:hypothetical protein